MSTTAQNRYHIYLVENPKWEMQFKMVVSVGLQDINSMYITQENPFFILNFKNYAASILRASALEIVIEPIVITIQRAFLFLNRFII